LSPPFRTAFALLDGDDATARRIEAAASADFVIGLYNPASGRRQRQIVAAQQIIRRHREGSTPVALIKSAYQKLQHLV